MKKSATYLFNIAVLSVLILALVIGIGVISYNTYNSYIASNSNTTEEQEFTASSIRVPSLSGFNILIKDYKEALKQVEDKNIPNTTFRFGISVDELFPRTDMTSNRVICNTKVPVNCNPQKIAEYKQILKEIKSKNITIIYVTNVPYLGTTYSTFPTQDSSWRVKYSLSEYLVLTKDVFTIMGTEFGEYVDYWNIFNEPNAYAFDSHKPVQASDYDNYLNTFYKVFAQATSVVKATDRNMNYVTTDLAGIYSPTDKGYFDWAKFLNKVIEKVDVVSFNVYPFMDDEAIKMQTQQSVILKNKYKKPLFITETGICRYETSSEDFLQRADYISGTVRSFRKAGASMVLVYQMKDATIPWYDDCMKSFGIYDKDNKATLDVTPLYRALRDDPLVTVNYQTLGNTNIVDNFKSTDVPLDSSFWKDMSRQFTKSSEGLTLSRGDWLVASPKVKENSQVKVSIDSLSNNGASWASITFKIGTSEIILLKENWGYTLHITKDGFKRRYWLKNVIDPLELTFIVQNRNIFIKANGEEVSPLTEFYISNLPESGEGYDFSMIVTGPEGSNPQILLSSLTFVN